MGAEAGMATWQALISADLGGLATLERRHNLFGEPFQLLEDDLLGGAHRVAQVNPFQAGGTAVPAASVAR